MLWLNTPEELIALAVALGARHVEGWSNVEEQLTVALPRLAPEIIRKAHQGIQRGRDPLGDMFSHILSPEQRRPRGAVYTPHSIVAAMLNWAANQSQPTRVIDPGTGSGRFLVAAGRKFNNAWLLGIENDPLAAILARGHLASAGLAERATIIVGDYRNTVPPSAQGQTLFIGNPPYVRHHLIEPCWKEWLAKTARKYGYEASKLAGLHVHFFLATVELANVGDVGIFITAAEWLDVNYGKLVRELLLGSLGAKTIHVIEPTAEPFPGTATTAAIAGFEVGTHPKTVALGRVERLTDLDSLATGRYVRRERLESAYRWTPLTRSVSEKRQDFVELGELCRVHRGQVTGANKVWIAGPHSRELPSYLLFHSVTKARELFAADASLNDVSMLRRVIDLPVDLDALNQEDRRNVDNFLKYAKAQGVDHGFVARNRKAWWSVGLREPAPILATYMARRPPVFVRNLVDARHINIAHGLYPREPLTDTILHALAKFLSQSVSTSQGRTYAGGLTKFEPKEMERLMVPRPEILVQGIEYEDFVK